MTASRRSFVSMSLSDRKSTSSVTPASRPKIVRKLR